MDEPIINSTDDGDMDADLESIAIIGWSGRFPGAEDIDSFWEIIRDGKESIAFYSEEELREAGIPEFALRDPNFVRAASKIKDAEMFDAEFFAYTPREALLMDPQHRVFLESAWHALEDAGIDTKRCAATIGVFAGTNPDNYMLVNANEKEFAQAPAFDKRVSSDSSFFTSRVAYKLNLKGPALTIQTACSTSLVAICVACQHLINYQCDVALAGASTVMAARKSGYMFQAHGINSPDGHCRAFDADSKGTIGGEGVATVVLKRLEDALADGDSIHAVIKGWALNNDGNAKVGFTAPSVDGQAEVIEMAQALAGISADSIGYLEAHGTGTELGDPIEVAALTQAFSATTNKTQYCALGSVKANVGHLDAAAGITGLIKASLVLKNKQIPPLLHFHKPNPKINFEASPFYINKELQDWTSNTSPRRAAVSSFGMGGTNAHVILDESPALPAADSSRSHHLLMVSARSQEQCDQARENLGHWLEQHPQQALADVAYTLQTGRRQFAYSAICVADNSGAASAALRGLETGRLASAQRSKSPSEIAFMFPGQGNQYLHMGLDLYRTESAFREVFDRCSDLIRAEFDFDLRQVVYPSAQQDEAVAAENLTRTEYAQPALFVVEYAMAGLLMSWGIKPQALIGHSIGEYVAATLAGVFSLGDALKLVVHRGRLMQSAPAGTMAAIPLSAERLAERLPEDLCIAVINEAEMCVVSGASRSVSEFIESCERDNLQCYQLHTSHAFHSPMMDGILDEFSVLASRVVFSAPQIPFLSNLSGDWVSDQQAMDPAYWVSHIRQAVLFADGVHTLLQEPSRLLYEVGPGNSLSTVALRHSDRDSKQRVVTSMRHPREQRHDLGVLLESLGQTWQAGVDIDWSAFYQHEQRRKIPLPGYPFARKRYWIERSAESQEQAELTTQAATRLDSVDDWLYLPSWTRQPAVLDSANTSYLAAGMESSKSEVGKSWLIFDDQSEFSEQLVTRLKQAGERVIRLKSGDRFERESVDCYRLSGEESDYFELIEALIVDAVTIDSVIYLRTPIVDSQALPAEADMSFYAPLFLVKALNSYYEKSTQRSPLEIYFVTESMQQVNGYEEIEPLRSLILGVSKVCSREMPHLRTVSIDLESPSAGAGQGVTRNIDYLLAEILSADRSIDSQSEIAYRGQFRWTKTIERLPVKVNHGESASSSLPTGRLKKGGIYLVTGGLGGIGAVLAEFLAQDYQACLLLTGRTSLPDRSAWDDWIDDHEDTDGVSRKIGFIRELEDKGAQVVYQACDVADSAQMTQALQIASDQFGKFDGVIHSAGIPAGGLIQLKNRHSAAEVLAAKVQGALVLDGLFQNQQLDFMVFCSSLAAVLANAGQVDYTAANIFLDSLALQRQQKGQYTVSINWDTWSEVGMAVEVELPGEYQASRREALDAGIRSSEGVELFARVLRLNIPQVIVSTRALPQRIALLERQHLSLSGNDSLTQDHDADTATGSAADRASTASLPENYVAPRNDIESQLCGIWQEMFGIEHIGIEDNFFELGGHSLLAVQILSRVNVFSPKHVSLNDFFDAVTIAELALVVGQIDSAPAEDESSETTADMVDALSDEEVERLLAAKGISINEQQG